MRAFSFRSPKNGETNTEYVYQRSAASKKKTCFLFRANKLKNFMFIGEYEHTLDEKKRVSLPKQFRAGLGRKVVMTRGLDNCLFVYSQKSWEKVASKLQELSFAAADTRGFNRFILSGAAEVEIDSAGRILIPEHQREFAGLKKTIVFAGVSDRVEVWDAEVWKTYKGKIEKQAERMAETLGSIGAL